MQAELSTLTPRTAQQVRKLLKFAERQGIPVTRIDSAYRSCSQQNELHAAGITPAPGCRSWHTWGRAVDLYIPGAYQEATARQVLEDYAILGERWREMGGIWGGDFSYVDAVHFEWHPDLEINDVCPDPTGPCGSPPWPDDRPFYARPAALGMGLAAAGGLGAVYVLRRTK